MTDYNLITLDELKVFMNITKDDHDPILQNLINSVSALVEVYCDRQLKARDYSSEYHDGTGDTWFFTDQFPINSVTGVWDDVDRDFGDTTELDSDDYVFYTDGRVEFLGTELIIKAGSPIFSEGSQNIKIHYNAGYLEIPEDIKMITAEIIMKKFKNFMEKRIGVTNISSAGEGISYNLGDILPEHKMVLNLKYRKKVIG